MGRVSWRFCTSYLGVLRLHAEAGYVSCGIVVGQEVCNYIQAAGGSSFLSELHQNMSASMCCLVVPIFNQSFYYILSQSNYSFHLICQENNPSSQRLHGPSEPQSCKNNKYLFTVIAISTTLVFRMSPLPHLPAI